MFCEAKSAHFFFLRCNFGPLTNKNVQMLYHLFPLLFPKDSESLKILDIQLREVGAKRLINGTSKVNTHTHTYGQIDLLKASAQRADALKTQNWAETNIF